MIPQHLTLLPWTEQQKWWYFLSNWRHYGTSHWILYYQCSGDHLLLYKNFDYGSITQEINLNSNPFEKCTHSQPTNFTVVVIKNETLLFGNFSAQDASILKISVPIIKRRSWGFQNTPSMQNSDYFEPRYGNLKKIKDCKNNFDWQVCSKYK